MKPKEFFSMRESNLINKTIIIEDEDQESYTGQVEVVNLDQLKITLKIDGTSTTFRGQEIQAIHFIDLPETVATKSPKTYPHVATTNKIISPCYSAKPEASCQSSKAELADLHAGGHDEQAQMKAVLPAEEVVENSRISNFNVSSTSHKSGSIDKCSDPISDELPQNRPASRAEVIQRIRAKLADQRGQAYVEPRKDIEDVQGNAKSERKSSGDAYYTKSTSPCSTITPAEERVDTSRIKEKMVVPRHIDSEKKDVGMTHILDGSKDCSFTGSSTCGRFESGQASPKPNCAEVEEHSHCGHSDSSQLTLVSQYSADTDKHGMAKPTDPKGLPINEIQNWVISHQTSFGKPTDSSYSKYKLYKGRQDKDVPAIDDSLLHSKDKKAKVNNAIFKAECDSTKSNLDQSMPSNEMLLKRISALAGLSSEKKMANNRDQNGDKSNGLNEQMHGLNLEGQVDLDQDRDSLGFRYCVLPPVTFDASIRSSSSGLEIIRQSLWQSSSKPPHFISADRMYLVDESAIFVHAIEVISKQRAIGLSIESVGIGRLGTLSLINIATTTAVFSFDMVALGAKVDDPINTGLKHVLQSQNIIKVVHDVRFISDLLFNEHDISLEAVFDTMVADVVFNNWSHQSGFLQKYARSYLTLCREYLGISSHSLFHSFVRRGMENEDTSVWMIRPLPNQLKLGAARNCVYLLPLMSILEDALLYHFRRGVSLMTSIVRDSDFSAATNMASNPAVLPSPLKLILPQWKMNKDLMTSKGFSVENSFIHQNVGSHRELRLQNGLNCGNHANKNRSAE